MSTTVTYKGSTLTTAENQTKKLKTSGKYMEDDVTIVDVTSGGDIQSQKNYTVSSAGTANIEPDEGYDGMASVALTTPSASITNGAYIGFGNDGGYFKWSLQPYLDVSAGWVTDGEKTLHKYTYSAISAGTTITPSSSSQTVGGNEYMMQGAVTVEPIPSQYIVPSGNISLTQSTSTDVKNYATATVSAGTAGTPTATKGVVNNHAISVTPSVTNTTGWITGSTKTGTAVSVSASELVSGTLSISSNGQQNVTNYQYVDVSISGSVPTGNIDISQAGVTDVTNYATATVPSASIYGGYDASVTPSITVNASGVVEAEVVIAGYTFPFCYGSGWVDTSAETTIRIQGWNTYQLTVGDSLEYGITDGTLPLVGVAKVGQAEI